MESEEYACGREAYERGDPTSANPYYEGSGSYKDWERGWRAAERDAKAAYAHLEPQQAVRTSDMLTLNQRAWMAHEANHKWWHDPKTGAPLERNKGELICLMHSELSECMEGERKDLMDDKLPHRKMAEVELADVLIRIFDYAGAFGYDLDGAVNEKMAFNAQRQDHTYEARAAANGKKW